MHRGRADGDCGEEPCEEYGLSASVLCRERSPSVLPGTAADMKEMKINVENGMVIW